MYETLFPMSWETRQEACAPSRIQKIPELQLRILRPERAEPALDQDAQPRIAGKQSRWAATARQRKDKSQNRENIMLALLCAPDKNQIHQHPWLINSSVIMHARNKISHHLVYLCPMIKKLFEWTDLDYSLTSAGLQPLLSYFSNQLAASWPCWSLS